jgi:Fur family ferric uptake transcriptional regulator
MISGRMDILANGALSGGRDGCGPGADMLTKQNRTDMMNLRADLHGASLRATPSRMAVLGLLRRTQRALSHAEVVEALGDQAWNRSTLYRNLIDLVEANLAWKTEAGGHVWRFIDALRHASGDHPHFFCTECGKVTCLPDMAVQLTPTGGGPQAVQRRQIEVQFRGRCDDCR